MSAPYREPADVPPLESVEKAATRRRGVGVVWRYEGSAKMTKLAKDAIELVLKHEWSGWADYVGDGGVEQCCECHGLNPGSDSTDAKRDKVAHPEYFGHKPGCKWAAVVAAARALG